MTVIAWDGTTLAADKRVSFGNTLGTVRKIIYVPEHRAIIGACGSISQLMDFFAWFKRNSQKAEDYPKSFLDDSNPQAIVIKDDLVYIHEKSAYPTYIEQPFFAIGSGRDFAIAAMHCGKTAREAVEIACLYDAYCGNGVDEICRKK